MGIRRETQEEEGGVSRAERYELHLWYNGRNKTPCEEGGISWKCFVPWELHLKCLDANSRNEAADIFTKREMERKAGSV